MLSVIFGGRNKFLDSSFFLITFKKKREMSKMKKRKIWIGIRSLVITFDGRKIFSQVQSL